MVLKFYNFLGSCILHLKWRCIEEQVGKQRQPQRIKNREGKWVRQECRSGPMDSNIHAYSHKVLKASRQSQDVIVHIFYKYVGCANFPPMPPGKSLRRLSSIHTHKLTPLILIFPPTLSHFSHHHLYPHPWTSHHP